MSRSKTRTVVSRRTGDRILGIGIEIAELADRLTRSGYVEEGTNSNGLG